MASTISTSNSAQQSTADSTSSSFFTNRTILITGGTSGIGLALAERLLAQGNQVIITGRRSEYLAKIKERLPSIHTYISDVSSVESRIELAKWAISTFPNLDILINNAGIIRKIDLTSDNQESWDDTRQELATNLEAPIHLTQLFVPHLKTRPSGAIANNTSLVGFVPVANSPVYCATKAALHSFTQSLRYQLRETAIRVIEIAPPAVQTEGASRAFSPDGREDFKVPSATSLEEYIDATIKDLNAGEVEITFGLSKTASRASRDELDQLFAALQVAF